MTGKRKTTNRPARRTTRKSSPRRRKQKFSLWKWLFKWSFIAAIWIGVILTFIVLFVALDLPDIDKLSKDRQPQITFLSTDGTELGTYGGIYGEYAQFHELPPYLIGAVIATEDRRFFDHFGLDVWGLARAVVVNIAHGGVRQGGSTITQQLAKIGFLTHERTFKRKLQEVLLALYLENKLSKEQILTLYLNRVYLGAGNYGVDSASEYYFGKKVSELDLYEAAMIAGLIRAPSRYAPDSHPEAAAKRATQVLENMANAGVLYDPSVASKGYFMPKILAAGTQKKQRLAPYFTDWLVDQLPDYIGNTDQNITVKTTLDIDLQDASQNAISRRIAVEGTARQANQGAMVVLAPDGAIRAMTGGSNYAKTQYNRATQSRRQTGSAFKIFVYTAAIEAGYRPDDIVIDEPVEFSDWAPANYKNEYLGDITFAEAFAKSINTVAVKLAHQVGMKSVIQTARRMGITSEIKPNLSSALGSSEMSLLEMTGAYAHFPNRGNAVWTHGITEVIIGDETVYKLDASPEQRVLAPETVVTMNRLLMQTIENGTAVNADIDRDAGGKTGTSQNYRDAWFIGFTPEYVAGVWFGNDDNSQMQGVAGGGMPARTWKEFMTSATSGTRSTSIPTTVNEFNNNGQKYRGLDSLLDLLFGKDTDEDE